MRFLFLLPAFFCVSPTFAQNTAKSPDLQYNSAPVSNNQPVNDSLAGETIEHCNAMIKAIDNKVAHVQSDQAQREKAVANGWFDRMAANRERFSARKKALEERNTTK